VAAALVLAACLAAPALLGARALLAGTARGAGFPAPERLGFSASLPVLLEAVWPRFLGGTHTFTDAGYWGQAFSPSGSPFFLSLYLGPVVLLLALGAGKGTRRLWALAALGVLLALGRHGPLGLAPWPFPGFLRHPVKLFLLATLALALLAGRGLERARAGEGRLRRWAWVPGLALLAAALVARLEPGGFSSALSLVIPEARGPLAGEVIRGQWPLALASTGALALGAGLAVLAGLRLAAAAGVLAVVDLLVVNGGLNPSAEGTFFDLRPEVREVVEPARAEGPYRWFSYGVAGSAGLHWDPAIVRQDSDVWLFYFDRQSLLPRTHVLDGLDGAFDVDRMGLAPAGSTLEVGEARSALFREHHRRLRGAGVRWVLGFDALPEDLVRLWAAVPLPGAMEPLRLHEMRDPLPRAFWAGETDAEADPGGGPEARVSYRPIDPHTVRLEARTPPGFVVVLDGHHPDWVAEDESGPVPVLRARGRYRALPTPGGERHFTLRYRPRWPAPALALMALGALAALVLAARR
jgi:hypothetical protein